MTGQTLAEVLAKVYVQHRLDHAERGTVDSPEGFASSYAVDAGPAVTAHLAAILADPETVEAVAAALDEASMWPTGPELRGQMHARAAIAVVAPRLGVAS